MHNTMPHRKAIRHVCKPALMPLQKELLHMSMAEFAFKLYNPLLHRYLTLKQKCYISFCLSGVCNGEKKV